MSKGKRKTADLTPEEVERQRAETLPDREVMSTVSLAPQPVVDDTDPLFPIDPTPKDWPPPPVNETAS